MKMYRIIHGNKGSWTKKLRIMKLTVILLFGSLVAMSANTYSQNTRLNLSAKNSSLIDIFRQIEDQSEYYFYFQKEELKAKEPVSVELKEVLIDEVLDQVLANSGLEYKIIDRYVVVKPKGATDPVMGMQPGRKVSGKVTDSSGATLPGVSVIVKGTTTGVITDNNGNYSLSNIPANAILQFSFVGMKGQEIAAGSKTSINVTLAEETIGIEEVVAVGYGTMKKSDVTGSVVSISNEKLANRPSTNVLQAIQGNIAGVTITQGSSVPGSSPDIYIRGINSISASNSPLIIIDGVPGDISNVNSNDIESIDILKDASSSAIYGARGANGVIIVTTKRGSGKPRVSYNAYSGIKQATNLIDFMGPEKYLYYRQKFAEYAGLLSTPADILKDEEYLNYTRGITTNWQDLVFKNAMVSEHNLSISGGGNSLNYFLSANYLDHDHIAGNYNLKSKSIRLNIDKEIKNWLKIGNNLQVVEKNSSGSTGSIWNVMQLNPWTSPTDPDGNIYVWPLESSTKYLVNPLTYKDADLNGVSMQINENIYASVKLPLEGLKYKISYGYKIDNSNSNQYYGINTAEGRDRNRYAAKDAGFNSYWILENIVDYKRIFKKHSFYFTGLYSAEKSKYEGMSESAYGFINDILLYNNLSAASNYNPPVSGASEWAMTSIMGRFNYNYNEKYMLTLTYRRDGYSAFGVDKKYGNFPSASIAWRVSQENFIKNLDFISQLKLRLSWGKNGNQAVSPYSSQAKISQNGIGYPFESKTNVTYGWFPSSVGNSLLGWETTKSLNLGVDFGLFNNRISGTVDIYRTETSDLLLTRAIPYVTGFSSVLANIGKTQNDGVEFSLNTININHPSGFKWTSNLNISYNKNQILDLYGNKKDDIGNLWFIGKPINVYYDYVFDGVWQESDDIANSYMPSAQPGTAKVKDISGPNGIPDGKIDATYDRQIVGNRNPDLIWGVTNTFQYKGFDLSIFIQGVQGVTGFYDLNYQNVRSSYMAMLDVNYWLPESPNNKYPTGIYNRPTTYTNTMGYCDASYIRLKDITLGYTIPRDVIQKIGIEKLRFYLNATNLFTITDWPLYDPETRSSTEPMTRSYVIGLNLSF